MAGAAYPFLRIIVRSLRTQKGLTQEALAEKAGVDYKYLQRFESGKTPTPTVRILEKLGRVLGAKPWVLLCDDPPVVYEKTGLQLSKQRLAAKPGRPRKIERPLQPKQGRGYQ